LIEVYEKLGIEIRQLPSGSQDSPKSGMAKIRGKKVFFLQPDLALEEKIELLKMHLKDENLDEIYLTPFLRRWLDEEEA